MTSCPRRFGITLAFLGFTFILPATVAAQPPIYLTQWGSLGSGDGQFREPAGVATDAAGDVYVADAGNARVQKFTGTGTYLIQWGTLGYGDGQFVYPFDVATDGDVYVADYGNRIQKFSATGTYLTQWGTYGSGNGQFNGSTGVATDATGNVYVADYFNNRIQKFTSTGTYVTQWGSQGSGDGQFNYPREVATDAVGNIYVVDQLNHRIQKFTNTSTYLTQWGSFGSGDGQFNAPNGVTMDAVGNVYVADTFNHRIQKFTDTGTYLTQWGSQGSGNGEFLAPVGMATDAAGNIYVADNGNHRIQKFGPAPTPAITMTFDLEPNTLNLTSRGQWVAGFLEPASPSAASDIDIASIRLNGSVPVDPAASTTLGDHNGNGVPDLMVKFNRAAVELTLSEGDNVAVNVTGTIGSNSFIGTDHIRVIRAAVSAPLGRSHLESTDKTRSIADGVLGVSEAFSIDAMVGVGDRGPAQLALRGVTPNPAQNELRVSFSLRDSKPATLALFDVSGRQVAARRVEGTGPGWHTVTLGGRSNLPASLYLIRLTQDGRNLTTRAVIAR